MAFPGWFAVTVQLPAPVMWTRSPVTVQSPLAVKLTARPDVAVALTVKSASPKVFPLSAPKLIVWLALAMCSVPVASVAW